MNKYPLIFLFLFYVVLINAQTDLISELQFEGNKKTKATFLRTILETKKGQPLDSTLIETDLIRLKRLPSISNATYKVIQLPNNQQEVQFHLEENFTLIPVFNYWTTINTTAFKIGVYEYNLFGRNMTFGGFYQNNGYNTFALNFNAPFLFSNKFGLGLNFLNWKSEEPLLFGEQTSNYLYTNSSYELVGSYEINFKNTLKVALSILNDQYDYKSGDTGSEIPNQLNLDKQLIKIIYTHENLDYLYFYVSGFKSVFNGHYITSKVESQNNFLILWNDFLYYKRIGEKGNWANRLRLGLSTNNESPFAPFALDNNINLRGVGNLVDRGTGSIVLNSEYRYTLFERKSIVVQGNGFMDFGTWRKPGKSLSSFLENKNINIYTGLGVRIIHKKIFNAILRIDYGYGITKNANRGFVFGIGQYF